MQVTHPIQPNLPTHPIQPAQVNTTNNTYKTDCKILKLVITKELLFVKRINHQSFHTVHAAVITTGKDQEHFLHEFQKKNSCYKPVSKTYEILEIFLETLDINTQTTKLIPLPPLKNQKKILYFLQNGRPNPKYCCVDFAMDIFDQYSIEKTNSITTGLCPFLSC